MNPLKKLKLKSKLRNCDYKLAGTVIKQQYYNDNSYTEVNRMIDHFMEEPGFDRALELIEYNEMIVFYFTESCTDGLYVRKAPTSVDPTKISEFPESDIPESPKLTRTEQAPIFATPPTIHNAMDRGDRAPSMDLRRVEPSAHSENLQKIQESEEWMDQMINRLAKKPKLPTIIDAPPVPREKFNIPIVTPPAKIYDDEEAESFDTIEFTAVDALRDYEIIDDVEPIKVKPEIEVFYEPEVFQEPEIINEVEVFYEAEEVQEPVMDNVISYETEDIPEPEVVQEKDGFEFVASAASNTHFVEIDPAVLFVSPPTMVPAPEPTREKRPSFPNVVATLKIDLHTMMKQLDEYRHQLAYLPHNEQQLIHWIESLEKAVDEFSNAIDIIEDVYE